MIPVIVVCLAAKIFECMHVEWAWLDASSLIRPISTSQEQLVIVSKDVVFFSLFIYFPTPSLI